jgi:hypothetical protein
VGGTTAGNSRSIAALILLILGAIAFVAALTVDDFWEAYPLILGMLFSGDIPTGEDAFAVSAIFSLPAVSFGPPSLFVWLKKSRLLTWLLRVCAFANLAVIGYFLITQASNDMLLLVVLTASTTFTFIGLCLIRHPGASRFPAA